MEQTAERPLKEHILVADEILKLKNLLDMGAITEEEFLTMKMRSGENYPENP